MQTGFQAVPPVGILFDSDLGNDIEDALALAVLYGLDGKNECRVVATTISKQNLKAAALCDAIARFYAGDVSGAYMAAGRTLPVGLAASGANPADTPMLGVLGKRGDQGQPVYRHGIESLEDTADPLNVLRNALSAQHPGNAVIVVTGPAANLAQLLRSPHARPFIKERCRFLVFAAGSYPEGRPHPGIAADIAAARQVFAEWPVPVIAVGSEIADAVAFPAAAIESEFAWTQAHPVVDAYKAHRTMPYDASTGALAAVLYAVRSKDSPFELSPPGVISILDDGRTRFTPSPEGRHRYLILDPARRQALQGQYIALASAKPVPRLPRRRFGQQAVAPPEAKPVK
jgi:inosine-uridine nucleoside N-ribohydrolase